ncbi:MAG: DUF485 domain-containing protein [Pirellulales bacterium]
MTLHHANVQPDAPEDPKQIARNARIGILLFWFYFLFYATYVLINTFVPAWMEWTPLLGINMAVLSGMGLIALAVIMAFAYGLMCRQKKGGLS